MVADKDMSLLMSQFSFEGFVEDRCEQYVIFESFISECSQILGNNLNCPFVFRFKYNGLKF
jgi:hypothetical protein